ncbi:MAG: Hsp33 family molecular chaperone HslO [Acidobacteriota bacterium]
MAEAAATDSTEIFARGTLQTGTAGGGELRWAFVDLTEIVETMRGRMDLSPVAAAALGRSLAGATLMLRMAAKTPSRMVLEVHGDGPLGHLMVEVDDAGNLRGRVAHRQVDVPHTAAGKLNVGAAVGKGLLRVGRERQGKRYQSQVELVSGEIGDDLAHYLLQSEQTRTAVLVGVLGKPQGVAGAGGLIVEVLPDGGLEAVERLESNIAATVGVSRLIEAGGREETLGAILAGLDPVVHEDLPVQYRCRCSRSRLRNHLAVLSREEIESIVGESGEIEADCVFCCAQYRFQPQDLIAAGSSSKA